VGGVWTRVEGDPVEDFGDRRVGAVGDKVGVGEGGVPTGGEGRVVVHVAGVGLEEGLRAGTGDETRPKVGVQESSADRREAVRSETEARQWGREQTGEEWGLRRERGDRESERGFRRRERDR
jgi:hypothetical protein